MEVKEGGPYLLEGAVFFKTYGTCTSQLPIGGTMHASSGYTTWVGMMLYLNDTFQYVTCKLPMTLDRNGATRGG